MTLTADFCELNIKVNLLMKIHHYWETNCRRAWYHYSFGSWNQAL